MKGIYHLVYSIKSDDLNDTLIYDIEIISYHDSYFKHNNFDVASPLFAFGC